MRISALRSRIGSDRSALQFYSATQVVAGSICLLGLLLPHFPRLDVAAAAAVATAAIVLGAILEVVGERLPPWGLTVAMATSTVLVGAGSWAAGRGVGVASMAVLYVPLGNFAGVLLDGPAQALELALIGAVSATVTIIEHQPGGGEEWLAVVATSVGCSVVVRSVAGRFRRMAALDALTGLPNRQLWEEHLARELARAGRSGGSVAVAILDFDDFKALNTALGHHGADMVLVEVATRWQQSIRPGDQLGRFGGDEFLLLLCDIDVDGARQLIDRLRSPSIGRGGFSAGLAFWDRHEAPRDLMIRADRALFRAKACGRSQLVVATDLADGSGCA